MEFLQSESFRVTQVIHGQAALRGLKGELQDVILLDLLFPDIHGQKVLKQIHDRALPVTVVVVTSQAGVGMAVKALHASAFNHYGS